MILLPAIDLMDGQVVRLRQGKAGEKTVYSDDPVAMARRWEAEGGDWLHIVDLDAAFTGTLANLRAVTEIAEALSIPCELGGGMRDRDSLERAFEAGVARVVIGTRAAESLEFIREIAQTIGNIPGEVRISGHTDNRVVRSEMHSSSWDLSSARAVSVAEEMSQSAAFDSSRMTVQGFADTRPLVPNNSEDNRRRNRRVEIAIMQGNAIESDPINAVGEQ